MEPQASHGLLGAEGDCEILSLLLPSPQSEAMTHDMEELSLQPTQSLPPLNERKNGKNVDVLSYTYTWLLPCSLAYPTPHTVQHDSETWMGTYLTECWNNLKWHLPFPSPTHGSDSVRRSEKHWHCTIDHQKTTVWHCQRGWPELCQTGFNTLDQCLCAEVQESSK